MRQEKDAAAIAEARSTGTDTTAWFELRCTACGHLLTVAIAPDECPICRGSVWEYGPVVDLEGSGADPSESLAILARRVIGRDSVRRWRFEQLQRAGYPSGDAFVLSACSDVDLHQAIGLLGDQCPVATAIRILI